MRPHGSGWLVAVLLASVGCADSSGPGLPRSEVIADLVADVMVPAHAELAAQAAALADASVFCRGGQSVTLDAAQDAWRRAHRAMGRTEAFGYGPARDDHYGAALLFWPTRPENVQGVVLGTEQIDAALIGTLGATSKGLPAIEAQVFDPSGGNEAVLARFDPGEVQGQRRCQLLELLADDASSKADALSEAWADSREGFGRELAEPATDGSRYASSRAALDEIVNGAVFMLERVDDVKLGKPLGFGTGGIPQPALVPAPWAEDSIAMIRANLEGLTLLWRGAAGMALRDLVALRSEELAPRVDAALDAADLALAGIDAPLQEAVTTAPAQVQAAIDRIKDVRRLFTVDVAQQLDVTITLSDNDGD